MQQVKPILFFLIVGSIAGLFIYREATRVNSAAVNIGAPAPDFSVKDENGRDVKLSDFRGKVVFLNFWATWCIPCVEEAPEMETLYTKLKDKKFQMMAVSIDLNWDLIRNFYKEHNLIPLPTFLDPGGQQIARGIYKVTGWPETFIIDANGSVVKHIVGPAHWADPRIIAGIEALLPEGSDQVSAR